MKLFLKRYGLYLIMVTPIALFHIIFMNSDARVFNVIISLVYSFVTLKIVEKIIKK